jgi:hypothetical protein
LLLFFGPWVADDRLAQKLERGLGDVSLTLADGHQARRTTCYPDRIQWWLNPPNLIYAYASSEETSAPHLSNGRKVVASQGWVEQRSVSKILCPSHYLHLLPCVRAELAKLTL